MRRVVVIVLALVVVAPTLALAQAYRCRFDDAVRAACCCPDEEEEGGEGHEPHAVIAAACCCEVIAGTAPDASGLAAVAAGVQLPAVTIVEVAEAPVAAPVARAVAHVSAPARAPPGPLFLTHCSLLL